MVEIEGDISSLLSMSKFSRHQLGLFEVRK